jgi:uncharacterized protein (DUF1330 family)
MPAYFIARVKINDSAQYEKYLQAVPDIIIKYNGKVKVRTESSITLEGPEENRRIIMIEFDSVESTKRFYYSDEYQNAKKLRENAAIGEIIVVDGIIK